MFEVMKELVFWEGNANSRKALTVIKSAVITITNPHFTTFFHLPQDSVEFNYRRRRKTQQTDSLSADNDAL